MKNYFKVFTFLFTFILLTNCEKDDTSNHIEQVLSKEKFHSRHISGTEIPKIINLINKETKSVLTTKSSSTTNYGELNIDDILEVIDSLGNTNYSFRISNIDDDGFSLYNLVVYTDENGNTGTPYVVKYAMEENFANDFYANVKGFDEFTGTIARYTIDAFLEGHSTKYAKGTPELNCPCDETTLDGGTNNPNGGSSGSDPDAPDGGSSDGGTSGGGGGGGYICWVTVVATPCSCVGHTYQGCNCANVGGTNASYAYEIQCAAKSFNQKADEDCSQDTNGACPEDDGYVGVNTDTNAIERFIEDKIVDTNLDPCSKSILDQLKNLENNDIAQVLSRFGDATSAYDWEIQTGTPSEPGNSFETNWKTDSDGNAIANQYITLVNTSYVDQATDLAIARVILHEAIHAYILSYLDDVISNSTDPTIVNIFQNNFSEVWNFYVAQQNGVAIGNIEDAHHEQMAATFIDIIGDALAEYDNNQQDSQYYEYLAWGALMNTNAFSSALGPNGYMTQSDQEAIFLANESEDTNNVNAIGSPCP